MMVPHPMISVDDKILLDSKGSYLIYSNLVKNYRRRDKWGGFNVKTFIQRNGKTTIEYMYMNNKIFTDIVNRPNVLAHARMFNPEFLI